jgi:hypothetical protein
MSIHCVVHQEIYFNCENCGKTNNQDYSLEKGVFEDRPVLQDHIDCSWCDFENHVIIEYSESAAKMLGQRGSIIKNLNNAADYVGRGNAYSEAIEEAIKILEEVL